MKKVPHSYAHLMPFSLRERGGGKPWRLPSKKPTKRALMPPIKALRPLALLMLLWSLLLGASTEARAHPANVAGARAKIALDGTFVINARFDILAYIVGQPPLKVADAPMNALLDGPPENLKQALSDAQTRFAREMKVRADNGAGTIDSVEMPTLSQVQDWRDSGIPPRLPVMLTVNIKGHFPPGAQTVSLALPAVLGPTVVTIEIPTQEPFSQPLDAGAFSTPLTLAAPPAPTPLPPTESPAALYKPKKVVPKVTAKPTPKPTAKAAVAPKASAPKATPKPTAKAKSVAKVAAVASGVSKPRPPAKPQAKAPAPKTQGKDTAAAKANMIASAQAAQKSYARAAHSDATAKNVGAPRGASDKIEGSPIQSAAVAAPVQRPSWFANFGGFVAMGFHHIVPAGVDHILFVLGLFLLGSGLPALVKQITAFTVAHSITLALAASGMVRLPSSIVEPLIALSIVFVAVENLSTTQVRPTRIFVVFAFGLVHGLGFAEVFQNLGLTGANFLTALAGFNIGVELGQLSVVAAALLAVGWFRKREGYRKFVVVPASLGIAAVAAFWTLQRVFFAV